MTTIRSAIDVLFGDPHIAIDAVYKPAGGAQTSVRVIIKRPDEIVSLGDTRIHSATTVFDLRVSEVTAPASGDILEIGSEVFIVHGEPVRDAERLIWTIEARPT